MGRGSAQARAELCERLRARSEEIEQAALARAYAIGDPEEVRDPEYLPGLRATVRAAIEYGIAVVEHGEERAPPVPRLLLGQARLAAACGVELDTMLRRYFAGYSLLGDFLMQEAGGGEVGSEALQQTMRSQAAVFDRILVLITHEYHEGARRELSTVDLRRAERVRRLLEGELMDVSELPYEFDCRHVGVVAAGLKATVIIRELAGHAGLRLLLVTPERGQVWAWLGGRQSWDPQEVHDHLLRRTGAAPAAMGEPADGIAGWRLTHRQAKAAMPLAPREPGGCARYRDVALIASVMRDELLCASLRQTYLSFLEDRPDGVVMRETLLAYLRADRNVSSAAAALGVNRQTVSKRLRAMEESLARPLRECATDLEVALRLSVLEQPVSAASTVAR